MKFKFLVLGVLVLSSASAFAQEISLPNASTRIKVQVNALDNKVSNETSYGWVHFLTPSGQRVNIRCYTAQLQTSELIGGIGYSNGFVFDNSNKCNEAVIGISDAISKNVTTEITMDVSTNKILQIDASTAGSAK